MSCFNRAIADLPIPWSKANLAPLLVKVLVIDHEVSIRAQLLILAAWLELRR